MTSFNRLMLVMRLDLLGLQHGAQQVVEEAQSHGEAENVFPSHDYLKPDRSGAYTRPQPRRAEPRRREKSDRPSCCPFPLELAHSLTSSAPVNRLSDLRRSGENPGTTDPG